LTPLNKTFPYARLSGKFAIRSGSSSKRVWGPPVSLDENARTVQVEYDASRLHANDVAAFLSEAGIALLEWPPAAV
jgi:hypothetical protein